jgi:hypothetical protein
MALDLAARVCTANGCERPCLARGYCRMHYQRAVKSGVIVPQSIRPADERFASGYVADAGGCWIWQGKDLNESGHARFFVDGQRVLVHRWAYERFVGPIPDGLVLDHLCRKPSCVRPTHLEPVTQPVNVSRAPTAITTINSAKTHCIHGHEFAGHNLMWKRNGDRPCRQCRACHNRRARESAQRRRAA